MKDEGEGRGMDRDSSFILHPSSFLLHPLSFLLHLFLINTSPGITRPPSTIGAAGLAACSRVRVVSTPSCQDVSQQIRDADGSVVGAEASRSVGAD